MKTLICMAIASVMFTACSRDRDTNPVTNVTEAAKDRDLQKTFLSSCSLSPEAAAQTLLKVKSEQTMYRFEGSNVTREARYYPKTDCSGDAAFVLREKGTIKIDKNQKTNHGGYNIDMKWNTGEVDISTDEGAKAASTGPAPLCGKSDWKKGTAAIGKEISNAEAAKITCLNAKIPRDDYNIYRVDNGVLTLGRTDRTPNGVKDRPDKLEGTRYVSK